MNYIYPYEEKILLTDEQNVKSKILFLT